VKYVHKLAFCLRRDIILACLVRLICLLVGRTIFGPVQRQPPTYDAL